jgi:hypothetical protein
MPVKLLMMPWLLALQDRKAGTCPGWRTRRGGVRRSLSGQQADGIQSTSAVRLAGARRAVIIDQRTELVVPVPAGKTGATAAAMQMKGTARKTRPARSSSTCQNFRSNAALCAAASPADQRPQALTCAASGAVPWHWRCRSAA